MSSDGGPRSAVFNSSVSESVSGVTVLDPDSDTGCLFTCCCLFFWSEMTLLIRQTISLKQLCEGVLLLSLFQIVTLKIGLSNNLSSSCMHQNNLQIFTVYIIFSRTSWIRFNTLIFIASFFLFISVTTTEAVVSDWSSASVSAVSWFNSACRFFSVTNKYSYKNKWRYWDDFTMHKSTFISYQGYMQISFWKSVSLLFKTLKYDVLGLVFVCIC